VNYEHAVCVSVIRRKMYWQCQHKSDCVCAVRPTEVQKENLRTQQKKNYTYCGHNWSYKASV
jgi:hypothetical protein